MATLEEELQKMYDSEIHVDIGWLWDGGIDLSIGNDEVTGHVENVAEVLPWISTNHSHGKRPPSSEWTERAGVLKNNRCCIAARLIAE